MKPALFLTTPPLAFIAAAMLAGFVPPDDAASGPDHPIPAGPRKRAAAIQEPKSDPTGIPSILAEMERQIVHFPPPEVEIHDGKGMEQCLMWDKPSRGSVGGGMAVFGYSWDWARDDPAGMFEWLIHQGVASDDERRSLAETLFSEWATRDMAAALAAIPRMTHAESRAQAWVSTLEVLCRKDPAKARELLLQNLDSLDALKRVQFGFSHGEAWTELLQALPQGRIRSMLVAENINGLANGYSPGDSELAAELWKKSSVEERRALVAAGLRVDQADKIQLDGLEDLTKQHAETTNDPSQVTYFLDRYGASWAERDPNGALAWAMARLRGQQQMRQCLQLMEHAAAKDFDAAMTAWQSLPEGSLRNQAAKILTEAAPADRDAEKEVLNQATSSTQGTGAW